MNCLLIDNSNTRTKFAMCRPGRELELRVLPTLDISPSLVKRLVAGWQIDFVCICSVVPWAADAIRRTFDGIEVRVLDWQQVKAIDFSHYPGIETLGADRIANVLAASVRMPLPLVAVDVGTATTFDILVQGEGCPRFRGGVIAPGIGTMAGSLRQKTALLPGMGDWREAPIIGQNTQESMGSAIRIGYPAMVDAILDAVEKELGQTIHVILTGGDSADLRPYLRRSCEFDPLLTLRGIAFAAGMRL